MRHRTRVPKNARSGPIEGEVTAYGRFGEAWVEAPRGRFLVAGVVPGDRIAFTPEEGAKPPRGVLRELLEPSPERVTPACPVAARCGGCPLIFASASLENATKRGMIEAALRGLPGADAVEVTLDDAGTPYGYRRRVRLGFVGGRAPRLGYRARRSNAVIDVPGCPVLAPELEAALPVLRERLLPTLPASGGALRLSRGEGGRPVVSVEVSSPIAPASYAVAGALIAEGVVAGIALSTGEGGAPARLGQPDEVVEGIEGFSLRSGAAGFAQANDTVNRALVQRAVELAEADGVDVLELYAGAGNLSLPLARRARRLVTVEVSTEATAAARDNLGAHGLHAEVLTRSAGDLPRGRFDVVVLDPPRVGAAEALAGIVAARPARIVYVSCDPATLGRDLRVLTDAGYVVDHAHGFDMFPQTAHVESLVRLVRGD